MDRAHNLDRPTASSAPAVDLGGRRGNDPLITNDQPVLLEIREDLADVGRQLVDTDLGGRDLAVLVDFDQAQVGVDDTRLVDAPTGTDVGRGRGGPLFDHLADGPNRVVLLRGDDHR